MRVGFIGTGKMGNMMASCLLDAGHELTVYDLRHEATANLCERGARWAEGCRLVAEASELVFTSLPGPAEVEASLLAPDNGVLAGLSSGSGYIDLTTNAPGTIANVAHACRTRGVSMLDAPVSGRVPNLTVMVGGDPDTFTKYRPILQAFGRNVFHVGDQGKGCIAKLVTQYIGYANFIASVEGLLIAAKAGVDLNILARVVPVSAGANRMFDASYEAIFDRTFHAGTGELDIVAKDIDLACKLAQDLQTPALMGTITDDVFKRAQAMDLGDLGFPGAAIAVEQIAGIQLRPRPDE